ncbi:MAG: DUF5017 domain-containing protein [Porphyromonadaceae bacterium]|nr:DUF5017 domain-containing protein [Porphyromonadaceae bacterium]
MKSNIILFFIAASLFFVACNELEYVKTPEFSVTADKQIFTMGDTVIFNISGNPDLISFYSGESGNDYAYAFKDRILEATAELSFQSQVRRQSGPNSYCQEDQFYLYVSNDFKFSGQSAADSVADVQAATWTDITDLFTLCELECASTTAYQHSGVVDVSDIFEEGKVTHFAFRYVNRPYSDYGNGNIWRFSSFTLDAITDAGSVPITSQNAANWMPVFIGEGWEQTGRFTNTGTIVTMRGPSTNDVEQELWAVSTGLTFGDTNLGADLSVAIKTTNEVPLTQFKYVYTVPGTYTATFVAKNANIYDSKEVIEQIQITVTE